MDTYALTHLSDHGLDHAVIALGDQVHSKTAMFLAHVAEADARKRFLEFAYPSMHAYVVGKLHFSEDEAYGLIKVARTARRFPILFPALADSRLSLTAVRLLKPHLTEENVEEWLTLATHKSCAEIELLMAERMPRLDVPTSLMPQTQQVLKPVTMAQSGPEIVDEAPVAPARVTPLSPERFELQLTIELETRELLRYVQALLGHRVPSGDIPQVFHRALRSLATELEKEKFAATSRPRRSKASSESRYIPAGVQRAVWKRDGGKCTFVSEEGRRCGSRIRIEFDHVDPFARGGKATVEGIRLRCRAHNQYEAEKTYGRDFMEHKRRMAKQKAAEKPQPVDPEKDVTPWLRARKCSPEEAKRAAALCDSMPESATLEERIKVALRAFGPRTQPQMPGPPG